MKVINKYGVRVSNTKKLNSDGSYSYADDVSQGNELNFSDEFSYAFGDKIKGIFKKGGLKGKGGKGFLGGIFKKGKFKEFLGGLKAKSSARKLKRLKNKQGEEVHADVLPMLQTMSLPPVDQIDPQLKITPQNFSGLGKQMPDGTMKPISKEEVTKGPDGNQYEKQDLNPVGNEKAPEMMDDPNNPGAKILAKEVPQEDIVEVKVPNETNPNAPSTTETYKKSDVLDKDGKPLASAGMNPTLKWGLIIGGVVLAGVVIYLLARKKKSPTTVLSSGQGGFTQISS